ncbi:thioredoxin domain-containing protein [Alteromonadaceae bacterium M269]|nr:thioredoxin domain-containing protein [Alteromonadaceae bacterium M269]
MKQLLIVVIFSVLTSYSYAADEKIHWREWNKASFDDAKKQNKPILINVGHEGCGACRWMKGNTFAEPDIVSTVNKHFMAIQVDSIIRPDIGERYSDWAWPAIAFNTPNGDQVLALRGTRRADTFAEILDGIIEGHANGTLKPDDLAPYSAPEQPRTSPLTEIRDQVREQIEWTYDDEIGAWGNSKVIEGSARTLQFAWRAHWQGDEQAGNRFEQTARGYLKQLDPEWGGIYYSSVGRWGNVVGEKRLESQAAALDIFAEAYKLTENKEFKEGLDNVHRYLLDHMLSEEGLFFASHQPNIPGLPEELSIRDYYQLDDKQRRKYGLPSIDKSLFTDLNARTVIGLLNAYESTKDPAFLETAQKATKALLTSRKKKGVFIQFSPTDEFEFETRLHVVQNDNAVLLRPHAYLGLMFLEWHRLTANDRWLAEAQGVSNVLLNQLQDPELGGFYGSKDFIKPRKPLEDNAVAARFLYNFGVITKQDDLKLASEKAIRASAAPRIVSREGRITGNLALATELLTSGYVEFSIVGDAKDGAAKALFDASKEIYEPRGLVHYEKPGRYPKGDKPALYICNETACSVPIYEASNIPAQAKKFAAVLVENQQS